jgi:hypothetical protein
MYLPSWLSRSNCTQAPFSAPTEKIVAPNPDRPSAFSQRVGDVLGRSVVRMYLLVETDRKKAT